MLCCVGSLGFDVTVSQSFVVHGHQTHGDILHQLGGSAAIVAHNAAILGTQVCFTGLAGNDALGDAALKQLQGAGVETRVVRRGRSGSVLILISKDGERTMVSDPGDGMTHHPGDIGAHSIQGANFVHFEGWQLFNDETWTNWTSLSRLAKQAGVSVSLDASSATRIAELGVTTFLTRVAEMAPDVLLCDESEADILGLSTIVPKGIGCVVVHRGEKSTLIIERGTTRHVLPPRVSPIVDTAGAGDSFASGFCSALIEGADLEAAVHKAHYFASIAVSQRGCLIHMNTPLDAFVTR